MNTNTSNDSTTVALPLTAEEQTALNEHNSKIAEIKANAQARADEEAKKLAEQRATFIASIPGQLGVSTLAEALEQLGGTPVAKRTRAPRKARVARVARAPKVASTGGSNRRNRIDDVKRARILKALAQPNAVVSKIAIENGTTRQTVYSIRDAAKNGKVVRSTPAPVATGKRTRAVIDDKKRAQIVKAMMAPRHDTQGLAVKFGVSVPSLYAIRKKALEGVAAAA